MGLKEDIIGYMRGKERVTLPELYSIGINKDSARGVINASIKQGKDFIRLEKGVYKLR
jgi:hypothetical protein